MPASISRRLKRDHQQIQAETVSSSIPGERLRDVQEKQNEEDEAGDVSTVNPNAFSTLMGLIGTGGAGQKRRKREQEALMKSRQQQKEQKEDELKDSKDESGSEEEEDQEMEDVARNKDDPFHLHFSDEISTRMDYTVAAFDSKDQFTTTILNINNDTNAGTTTTTTSSISSSRSNIFCDSSKNLMTGISVKNAEEPFSNDPALTASLMDNNISNNYNTLTAFHVRDRIHESWKQINNKSIKSDPLASKKLGDCFTSLQLQMAPFVFNYKDVCYSNDAISVPNNRLQLVNMFCLHIMNHVQKSRSLIVKNNEKLKAASEAGADIGEKRDQGFARPTVLILTPFRHSAYEIINTLITLSGTRTHENKKRLKDEFYQEDDEEDVLRLKKPDDYLQTFKGNIDDCFKIGMRYQNKSVFKLFSDFYTSDILVASPLGLRMIIGSAGDKNREFDFLSSIECCIVDQCDVLMMQNWDHVEHIFDHLNIIPKDAHGCDFSRVKSYQLESRAKYLRQNILLSRFTFPEMNHLFNARTYNLFGRIRIRPAPITAAASSIGQVAVKVPQIFYRFDCDTIVDADDARFTIFKEKILPQMRSSIKIGSRIILMIPSYFDFVRVRNYLKEHNYEFAQFSEYTSNPKISKGRLQFFKGEVKLLLVTERFHFFKRYHIRGSYQTVFYSVPMRSDFYTEYVNRLEIDAARGEAGVSVIYTRFDQSAMERIVGADRCKRMCEEGAKEAYMFT